MRRLALAAMPFALLTLAAACGDGDKKDDAQQTTTAQESPTANVNEQPQVPDKQLPTPTPIPDTVPVIQVAFAGKVYAPMRSDFTALPKVKVNAGGKEYEGVSLAALAEKAAAKTDAVTPPKTTNLRNGRCAMSAQKLITSAIEQPTINSPPASSPQRAASQISRCSARGQSAAGSERR